MGGMQSYSTLAKSLNQFSNNLAEHAPFHCIDWHTWWKFMWQVCIVYMFEAINCPMAQGRCICHSVLAARQPHSICRDYNTIETEMGIPKGDKFVWYPETIPITDCGDGGPIKNTLSHIDHLAAHFLHFHIWLRGMQQTIFSGCCVALSLLSESSPELSIILQQVSNTLPGQGSFAIRNVKNKSWVCFNYKRFQVADWKYTFLHLNLSVGPTATYAMIELTQWVDGKPTGVSSDDFYDCLMSRYINPWDVDDYQTCIDKQFNGLTLSHPETLQYWGNQTETRLQDVKAQDIANGKGELWDDPKYERSQRVDIAQNTYKHGVLKPKETPLEPADVDAAHFFWSFIVTIAAIFVTLMFCVWCWQASEVLKIVEKIHLPTITEQCELYMDNNKRRSVRKKLKFRTNGAMNLIICQRMPYAIKAAAWTAHKYENENPNTTYASTLILVVIWIVWSDMRIVFSILWQAEFVVAYGVARAQEIIVMFKYGLRAIYIAYNLCSPLVYLYWWRAVLVGFRQQDWLVYLYGKGLGTFMLQVLEHWIKFGKRFCVRHCNHRPDFLFKMFNYYDCATIGVLKYNLVDFKYASQRHAEALHKIYNEDTTPAEEEEILSTIPPRFFSMFKVINELEFGSPIPDSLSAIWNQHLFRHGEMNDIQVYVNEICHTTAYDSFHAWDEAIDGSFENVFNDSRQMTNTQVLEAMQEQTFIQSQQQ